MKNLLRAAPLVLLLGSQACFAERADRNKPINVEANSLSVDDERHTQTLEGDVLMTQGTLTIRAKRMLIIEDAQGFQRGVATGDSGGKAYFRQKREGRTDYIEGEGERIEYDTRTDVAELFNKAWVKSGQDLIKGAYIWYDSVSEKYRAASSVPNNDQGNAAKVPAEMVKTVPAGRVRAVLQPQNEKQNSTSPSAENSVLLRSSDKIEKSE